MIKTVIKWAAICIFITAIFYFNPHLFDEIYKLKNLSAFDCIVLSILFILNQFILGLEIRCLCLKFDVHLGVIESFGLSSVRSIANFLPMGAGALSNALYLKHRKRLSYANYSATLIVSMVLLLLLSGFFGFIISIYLYCSPSQIHSEIIGAFFGVFIVCLLLLIIPLPQIRYNNSIARFINNYRHGYNILKTDRTIMHLIFLKTILLLLLVLRLEILFASMELTISFTSVALIALGIVAFRIMTLVPGNIGITEGLSGAIAAYTGSHFGYGFAGMAADRVIQTLWILFLGLLFIWYFGKKMAMGDNKSL
ncbi:MAG: flippase-like domain-containing protein [Desulfobacter sp.]|nr:MAG: flippase-like domain-containing protein [Desulfobacter sp.]